MILTSPYLGSHMRLNIITVATTGITQLAMVMLRKIWMPGTFWRKFLKVLKRGEAMLDQPWSRPEPVEASVVNEAVNLRLLEMFEGLPA